MGAGAGVPREVTVASSTSSRGSLSSSSSEREFKLLQASHDMLGDLSLQDLSRKFSDARSRLRHYDCAAADQRLVQWEKERREANNAARKRRSLARQSRTVIVKSCAVGESFGEEALDRI
jgi:hypothetical protein